MNVFRTLPSMLGFQDPHLDRRINDLSFYALSSLEVFSAHIFSSLTSMSVTQAIPVLAHSSYMFGDVNIFFLRA